VNYDRTVHARVQRDGTFPHRHEIVRYDRAGRWYEECPAAQHRRRALTVNEAASLAVMGTAYLNRPGGVRFDAIVRRLRGTA
jgi:hypothetical protein